MSAPRKQPRQIKVMAPDADKAADALLMIRPKGLLKIVTIAPDGDRPQVECFRAPDDRDAMRDYIAAAESKRNIYFEPNPPKVRANRRSKESDIAVALFSYVDCDPKKDGEPEDPAKAQKRHHARLRSGVVPPPTFEYVSGGGTVALWRHATPIKLDGPDSIQAVKAINIGLARELGTSADGYDACQSLDHLYRVPNTTNLPNAKKRAAGRGVSVAGDLKAHPKRRYERNAFRVVKVGKAATAVTAIGNADSVYLDELYISDRLRAIIENGETDIGTRPDDDSPSGWRMSLILGLKKQGLSDETILGILLHPDNAVSADRAARAPNRKAAEAFFKKEIAKATAMRVANVSGDFDNATADIPDADDSDFEDVDVADESLAPTIKSKPELRERFKAMRYADLKALPALKYTLDKLIPLNSLFVLFGNENAGKTFWALSLGLACACDLDFYGVPARRGKVIHVIGEGSRKAFSYRVDAWIKMTSIEYDIPETELEARIGLNWEVLAVPVTINSPKEVAEFLRANAEQGQRGLIILDTLMRNFEGNINEQVDVMAFVKGCDIIRRKTGATVLVLHHPGLKEVNRPAGSRSLAGACDGLARLFESKGRRIFKLIKLRDGDVNKSPLFYELESVDVEMDFENGAEDITSAYMRAVTAESWDGDDLLLNKIFIEKPTVRAELEGGGLTKSTIQRRLAKLIKAGLIEANGLTLTKAGGERVMSLYPKGGESDEDATLD